MAIVCSCPSCGKRYSFEDALAGKRVKCKHCTAVIAIPATEVPLSSVAKHDRPRSDDRLEQRPAPVKPAARARSAEYEDDHPPPPRMGYKPGSARPKVKRASVSSLSPVIKIGLSLIGGLLAFGGAMLIYFGITTGHPEAVWFGMAELSTCVFGGLAAVCNVKLMVMGYNSGYDGLPLFTPFRNLVWVLKNLRETGPLLLGNLLGILGLVVVWAITIPYMKAMQAPKPRAAAPAQQIQIAGVEAAIRDATENKTVATPNPLTVDNTARAGSGRTADLEKSSSKEAETSPEGSSASQTGSVSKSDRVKKALVDLKSADAGTRSEAVEKLRRTAPVDDLRETVRDGLSPLLDDQDGFLVIEVARAMARWLTPETVPALIGKLSDSRHGVRWEVIKILGELGDARAAGPIAERLKEDDIHADPALRRLGPAAEPALIEVLKNPDPILRMKACRILRVVGGKDTLTFMKSAKADPDLGVRTEAQLTMKSIFARVGSSAKK